MPRSLFAPLVVASVLVAACSLTDSDRDPSLSGPVEVVGTWVDLQIVCTVPLTIDTPYPIVVTNGSLRMIFPADGEPKASVERDFTGEEIETLWGAGVEHQATRSLEINPLVQFEDYTSSVTFRYAGSRGPGTLTHDFRCVAEPGSSPEG